MKAKLSFVLAVLALSLTVQPVPSPDEPVAITPEKCASFCARVLCVPYQTCGLYTNASGQTVCGCHGDIAGS